MSGSRTLWVVAVGAGQLLLLVSTFPVDGLGSRGWHHVASLLVVLAAAALLPGPMRSRRFLGVGVLATSVLATLSGFYLLYWKEGIRVDGYQDWGVFWHVAWSWAAAVFFFQHTWVNRVALAHFVRTSFRSAGRAAIHVGLYAAAVAGFVVSAGPGRTWFTNETYIPLSLWTWLVAVGAAYIAYWVLRDRSHATQVRLRAGVDLALVPMAALATLSGVPLLFFDGPLNAAGLQYASKFWHVGPSVLFAVLVFVHSAQLWSVLQGHWRKLGRTAAPRPS